MKFIGKFTVFIAVLFISIPIKGIVVMYLWGWFIMPIFKVPHLAILEAYGIALFVDLLTARISWSDAAITKDDTFLESMGRNFLSGLLLNGIFLLIGYAVTLFM